MSSKSWVRDEIACKVDLTTTVTTNRGFQIRCVGIVLMVGSTQTYDGNGDTNRYVPIHGHHRGGSQDTVNDGSTDVAVTDRCDVRRMLYKVNGNKNGNTIRPKITNDLTKQTRPNTSNSQHHSGVLNSHPVAIINKNQLSSCSNRMEIYGCRIS